MTSISERPRTSTRVGSGGPVAVIAVIAVAANVAIWAVARLLGVDFVVQSTARESMTVALPMVLATTLVTVAVGALVLILIARRRPEAVRLLAWLGLVVGLLTIAMPLGVTAAGNTKLALVLLHLAPALVWWARLRDGLR